jgi:PIN domain nuclease of toxin-antitoxin system
VDGGENVISVASYWEVVVKARKGLLSIADLPSWWQRATELTNARTLSIRARHIGTLSGLPLFHKDPFDRILIAQAIAEGLPFLTNDPQVSSYDVRTIW